MGANRSLPANLVRLCVNAGRRSRLTVLDAVGQHQPDQRCKRGQPPTVVVGSAGNCGTRHARPGRRAVRHCLPHEWTAESIARGVTMGSYGSTTVVWSAHRGGCTRGIGRRCARCHGGVADVMGGRRCGWRRTATACTTRWNQRPMANALVSGRFAEVHSATGGTGAFALRLPPASDSNGTSECRSDSARRSESCYVRKMWLEWPSHKGGGRSDRTCVPAFWPKFAGLNETTAWMVNW